MEGDDPAIVEHLLLYLYTLDYDAESPATAQTSASRLAAEVRTSILLTHISVYAAAEKYGVPALKAVAKEKFEFEHDIEDLWTLPRFLQIANEVYISTPASDRGLKDVVLDICVDHTIDIVKGLTENTAVSGAASANPKASDEKGGIA